VFVDELSVLKGSPRNERASAHPDDDPEGLPLPRGHSI
jgi:hypothetical protein